MARFSRPANSIETYEDLKVGERIWDVCGILPPFMGNSKIVTIAPIPFYLHPEYAKHHSEMKDDIVFSFRYEDRPDIEVMYFATDCNMQPGYSHNDNYCFKSEEDAKAAVEFLRKQWADNPDLMEQERIRREQDAAFDAEFGDYDYYEEGF